MTRNLATDVRNRPFDRDLRTLPATVGAWIPDVTSSIAPGNDHA